MNYNVKMHDDVELNKLILLLLLNHNPIPTYNINEKIKDIVKYLLRRLYIIT